MSNFLAIATVTATLRQVLMDNITTTGAEVTTLRPDRSEGDLPQLGVNLYLYQVVPNASYRNADLPTLRSDNSLIQRPRAALDLHYLLTFYGNENELETQRLLGEVVRIMHSRPVLRRQEIRATIASLGFLASSDLADDIELVKFTPLLFTLEELSKLWSVMIQTTYTLSVAYQASLVLIESDDEVALGQPVLEPKLYVIPLHQPEVSKITAQAGPGQPITAGSNISILGERLRGGVTKVVILGTEITPLSVNESRVDVKLPLSLQAGPQSVEVVHSMAIGAPARAHRSAESNVAAFLLQPVIKRDPNDPTRYDIVFSGSSLVVQVDPVVGKDQRVQLELLNSDGTTVERFEAWPRTGDTAEMEFVLSGVSPGDYFVRVRVDSADSPLDRDANNSITAPKVSL